ncbi:hypothetical protein [Olivibacter sp. XZL3]|uniref:hypothetical protein n=1 Tax=Olivibacter sp. XZL3 TaxID=1735116 RepID=UPI0010670A77|nr:hypothetical protein [Olivibacter sp. XZL3]
MKKYLLIFVLNVLALNISTALAQQIELPDFKEIEKQNQLFVGTWKATKDGVTYTLVLKPGLLPGTTERVPILLGSILVKKGDQVVRDIPIKDSSRFFMGGVLLSKPRTLVGSINDTEIKMPKSVYFFANEQYTELTWEQRKESGYQEPFAIFPEGLTFKKVAN